GLGLVLGREHGGYFGRGLDAVLSPLVGHTGVLILGVFTLLAGVLLVTGASVGAILRSSHHAVRVAGRSARRRLDRPRPERAPRTGPFEASVQPAPEPPPALVDVEHDYPDMVSEPSNPVLQSLVEEPELEFAEDTQGSLFAVEEAPAAYRLPDRAI